jgi:hypothetical protein
MMNHIRQIADSFEAMIALLIGLATANRLHRQPRPAVDSPEMLTPVVLPASRHISPGNACPHLLFVAPHAGAGGARKRATADRISANIRRDTAILAIWKVTYLPSLNIFARTSTAETPNAARVPRAAPPRAAAVVDPNLAAPRAA